MTTPLIQALVTRHGFATVNDSTADAFLEAHDLALLFFPGDAERLVESDDVAVILPEILKAIKGRITPALVAKQSERILQRRFRFNAFPSIVFLRRNGYLGVLSRVLDWSDYMTEIPEILGREVTQPPGFVFPEGCYSAGMPRPAGHEAKGDLQ